MTPMDVRLYDLSTVASNSADCAKLLTLPFQFSELERCAFSADL
jgi:hypothetical protein